MKVEVKQVEKKFEPIEFVITIESEEELCSLWHRFNVPETTLNNTSNKLKYDAVRNTGIFNELDIIVKHLKLKR